MSIKTPNKQSEQKNQNRIISLFVKKEHWPIYILIISSFASWSAWGLIINNTSPISSGQTTIPLFYLTFFLAIASSFALFTTLITASFSPRRTSGHIINIAIRQGAILGIISTIALVFQQFRVLTWWSIVLLLTMGILIEISFFDQKNNIHND